MKNSSDSAESQQPASKAAILEALRKQLQEAASLFGSEEAVLQALQEEVLTQAPVMEEAAEVPPAEEHVDPEAEKAALGEFLEEKFLALVDLFGNATKLRNALSAEGTLKDTITNEAQCTAFQACAEECVGRIPATGIPPEVLETVGEKVGGLKKAALNMLYSRYKEGSYDAASILKVLTPEEKKAQQSANELLAIAIPCLPFITDEGICEDPTKMEAFSTIQNNLERHLKEHMPVGITAEVGEALFNNRQFAERKPKEQYRLRNFLDAYLIGNYQPPLDGDGKKEYSYKDLLTMAQEIQKSPQEQQKALEARILPPLQGGWDNIARDAERTVKFTYNQTYRQLEKKWRERERRNIQEPLPEIQGIYALGERAPYDYAVPKAVQIIAYAGSRFAKPDVSIAFKQALHTIFKEHALTLVESAAFIKDENNKFFIQLPVVNENIGGKYAGKEHIFCETFHKAHNEIIEFIAAAVPTAASLRTIEEDTQAVLQAQFPMVEVGRQQAIKRVVAEELKARFIQHKKKELEQYEDQEKRLQQQMKENEGIELEGTIIGLITQLYLPKITITKVAEETKEKLQEKASLQSAVPEFLKKAASFVKLRGAVSGEEADTPPEPAAEEAAATVDDKPVDPAAVKKSKKETAQELLTKVAERKAYLLACIGEELVQQGIELQAEITAPTEAVKLLEERVADLKQKEPRTEKEQEIQKEKEKALRNLIQKYNTLHKENTELDNAIQHLEGLSRSFLLASIKEELVKYGVGPEVKVKDTAQALALLQGVAEGLMEKDPQQELRIQIGKYNALHAEHSESPIVVPRLEGGSQQLGTLAAASDKVIKVKEALEAGVVTIKELIVYNQQKDMAYSGILKENKQEEEAKKSGKPKPKTAQEICSEQIAETKKFLENLSVFRYEEDMCLSVAELAPPEAYNPKSMTLAEQADQTLVWKKILAASIVSALQQPKLKAMQEAIEGQEWYGVYNDTFVLRSHINNAVTAINEADTEVGTLIKEAAALKYKCVENRISHSDRKLSDGVQGELDAFVGRVFVCPQLTDNTHPHNPYEAQREEIQGCIDIASNEVSHVTTEGQQQIALLIRLSQAAEREKKAFEKLFAESQKERGDLAKTSEEREADVRKHQAMVLQVMQSKSALFSMTMKFVQELVSTRNQLAEITGERDQLVGFLGEIMQQQMLMPHQMDLLRNAVAAWDAGRNTAGGNEASAATPQKTPLKSPLKPAARSPYRSPVRISSSYQGMVADSRAPTTPVREHW